MTAVDTEELPEKTAVETEEQSETQQQSENNSKRNMWEVGREKLEKEMG